MKSQAPNRPDLDMLLEKAKDIPITPSMLWDQRVSFVYGQMMDCNPGITREQVGARAVEQYGPRPDDSEDVTCAE